jgi:ribonucleoside-diphosphate reductase alpha chain
MISSKNVQLRTQKETRLLQKRIYFNMNKPFYWLTEESRQFLEADYLLPNQTPEERIKIIADHAEKLSGIEGFSNKFYEYMGRGWFSLSSPVWANYGTERGLPVSCFGSYIEDNMESILGTHAEVGMLSKFGGGTSGFFGGIRPRGAPIQDKGRSSGSVHFIELFDKLSNVVSQGSVRRGFFSAYLPIEHDDFDEFVGIGHDGHPIQNITHGVTVTDKFMQEMIDGNKDYRKRWAKVIDMRGQVGYPYIFWSDTVNNNKPDIFKNKTIYASNMCSEIALPSNKDETFVCVLSSMSLLHYDDWKDTDAVETLTIFLDTVCTEFINVAEKMRTERPEAIRMIDRALNFCKKYRALGLGVLGFHSYLQSKLIPFESREAAKWNLEMIKLIQSKAQQASYQHRENTTSNATLLAIAPTKSSSFILGGVSQGIEPEWSNFYIKDLAKAKVTVMNPYLKKLIMDKEQDTDETWDSIKATDGSVQHLDFLTQREKDVFKTFPEINPETIIDYAAVRQTYIDQSQSVNLMIDPTMSTKDINALYIKAWQSGLKTLYYQYSLNAAQVMRREKYLKEGCVACEG